MDNDTPAKDRESYREKAEFKVQKIMSWDAPCYDACVEAEITELSGIPRPIDPEIVKAHKRAMAYKYDTSKYTILE